MVKVGIYLDDVPVKSITVNDTLNPRQINGMTLRCAIEFVKRQILALISLNKPDYMRHLIYDRGYADIAEIYTLVPSDIVFGEGTPKHKQELIYDMMNLCKKLIAIESIDPNVSHMLELGI